MPLRVLILARSTSSHVIAGGMERVLDEVGEGLAGAGFLVGLVTTVGGRRPVWSDSGSYWEVGSRRPGRYSRLWWAATRNSSAPWVRWSPDVVIAVGDAGTAALNARVYGAPVIVHAHGTVWDELVGGLASRSLRGFARAVVNLVRVPSRVAATRRAKLVVAISPEIRQTLTSCLFRVPESNIVVLPNAVWVPDRVGGGGLDTRIRAAAGVPDSVRVVMVGGSIDRSKGYDRVVSALRLPSLSGVHLVVAGVGPDLKRIKAMVRRGGLNGRVTFLGRLGHSEYIDWLSAVDAVVVPSRRREGMSLAVIEALALGVPVIATKQGARGVGRELPHLTVVSARGLKGALGRVTKRDTSKPLEVDVSAWHTPSNHRARLIDHIETVIRTAVGSPGE